MVQQRSDCADNGKVEAGCIERMDKFDRQMEKYFEHARRNLFPKLKRSAMTITILGDQDPDPKICLELGASILYEKPIVLLAVKGAIIPDALRRVAERIVEVDALDDNARQRLAEAVEETLLMHFPQRSKINITGGK